MGTEKTNKTLDFEILRELRDVFLGEASAKSRDYWTSRDVLEQYDRTFARRIAWKWTAVLQEMESLGWTAGSRPCIDIGSGTGAAAEIFLERFSLPRSIHFTDRSPRSLEFVREKFASLEGDKAFSAETPDTTDANCLLSHIVNELGSRELDSLVKALGNAHTFIWVEPGTPAHSKKLIAIREKMRDQFVALAPCPHNATCGLATGDSKDWCHHFAKPPSEVFQSAEWRKWSETLKIDLRSLPVSYLVMSKEPLAQLKVARVLGHPRVYTGYAQVLECRDSGVAENKILKRKDPVEFKKWKAPTFRMTTPYSPPAQTGDDSV